MNKLYFDLEIAPEVGYFYGRWGVDIRESQILRNSFLLNYSYKWNNEPIQREAVWHYVKKINEMSDKAIVKKLHKLLDQADIVVAHNAKKFDVKKANTFFLKHGLLPPSPYKVVDTLQVAKRHFGFESNSLSSLAMRLGCTLKKDSGGSEMMYRASIGDKEAQAHLEEYCDGDVQTLYEIEQKMLGWNTHHPNISQDMSCPVCGSHDLQKRGTRLTDSGASEYQRYSCNSCGAWSNDRKNMLTNAEKNVKLYAIK